jgi:hypothetical protein
MVRNIVENLKARRARAEMQLERRAPDEPVVTVQAPVVINSTSALYAPTTVTETEFFTTTITVST